MQLFLFCFDDEGMGIVLGGLDQDFVVVVQWEVVVDVQFGQVWIEVQIIVVVFVKLIDQMLQGQVVRYQYVAVPCVGLESEYLMYVVVFVLFR